MDHFGKAMPMPMFNFWNSNSRGCDKVIAVDIRQSLSDCAKPVANVAGASELLTPVSPKKRRPEFVDTAICSQAKRAKTGHHGGLPSPTSACADGENVTMSRKSSKVLDVERAKDVIQYQFGLEILMKHDELRLIEQELAKSMTALEQLRRCHLIPYPVQCPTPGQMLEISSGKGPALQSKYGQPVPKWAPPFGVVEGPYARHYAKWLIPDPIFDGIQPEARGFTETSRARNAAAEGRTTRNSMSDVGGFGKQRPARGNAGQRLQALSSGYPPVKDKQSPCTVKRSDGITVKLVCIDCHRWDFSSTQGFINHCRIAHKRDFKSHEEAAVHCGHPIEVDDSGAVVPNGSKTAPPGGIGGPAPGLVHPLARSESISDQQAYKDVLSRINVSLELYHAGKLPNVNSIPGARKPSRQNASSSSSSGFVGSSDAPYLSQLMQKKNLGRNLQVEVKEAKSKEDWDLLSPSDDYDVDQLSGSDGASTSYKPAVPIARTPAVMRMPARSAVSPSEPPVVPRPASSKSHAGAPSGNAESFEVPETPMYDDDMEVELSPNTLASNNAPSLVSDDGEYDDSDDGSSDSSDAMETESVSDVAEINLEEDSDERVPTPRSIRRVEKPNNKKNDEARHVTFVTPSPVPSTNAKGRRKQKV